MLFTDDAVENQASSLGNVVCVCNVITMTNNPPSGNYELDNTTHVENGFIWIGQDAGESWEQKLSTSQHRFQLHAKRINDCIQWDVIIIKNGFTLYCNVEIETLT